MTPEELFNNAHKTYLFLVENVKEIFSTLPEDVAKAYNDKFGDPIYAFDMLLQTALLKIATIDGDVNHNEIIFINSICDNYSLSKRLERICKENKLDKILTLETLESFSSSEVREISDSLFVGLESLVNAFIEVFAIVDLSFKKDYFDVFRNGIIEILDAFLSIDFNRSEYENQKAIEIVLDFFFSNVSKRMEEIAKEYKNKVDTEDPAAKDEPVKEEPVKEEPVKENPIKTNSLKASYKVKKNK